MIHGVAFNELFPTRYAVANLQYRYEALFFLYPYLEATWGLVERPVFTSNGAVKNITDSMPALDVHLHQTWLSASRGREIADHQYPHSGVRPRRRVV